MFSGILRGEMLALQRLRFRLQADGMKFRALTRRRKVLAGRAAGKSAPHLGWCALGLTKGGRMFTLRALLRCEKGANAIEYALVASLIAIAAVGAFHNLANALDGMYNNVENHM